MSTENQPVEAPSNLRIWDRLSKTDPRHTKRFQRSGGFSGTAIKPIWTILRMTEVFGPCGSGWGMEKPEFVTQPGSDGEQLVFCTTAVWYVLNGSRGVVYGVGGDKFVISQKSGLRASDEAYKMAYTDAIGNAIKFVGVAADIHMGRFDDNKYLEEVKAEFAGSTELPVGLSQDRRVELETGLKNAGSVGDLLSVFSIAIGVANKAEDGDAIQFLTVKMTDRMIDIVGESDSLSSLESNYKLAYATARTAGDGATMKLLEKAKDTKKKQLSTTPLKGQLKASLEAPNA
jgi:hypothetical protein